MNHQNYIQNYVLQNYIFIYIYIYMWMCVCNTMINFNTSIPCIILKSECLLCSQGFLFAFQRCLRLPFACLSTAYMILDWGISQWDLILLSDGLEGEDLSRTPRLLCALLWGWQFKAFTNLYLDFPTVWVSHMSWKIPPWEICCNRMSDAVVDLSCCCKEHS